MKFRAMLCDTFIDVQASDELAAQEMAFAKCVRDLSPSDFIVWQTDENDAWKREQPA